MQHCHSKGLPVPLRGWWYLHSSARGWVSSTALRRDQWHPVKWCGWIEWCELVESTRWNAACEDPASPTLTQWKQRCVHCTNVNRGESSSDLCTKNWTAHVGKWGGSSWIVQRGQGSRGEQKGGGMSQTVKLKWAQQTKLLVYTIYTAGRQNSMTIYIHLPPKQPAYKPS